LLADGSHFNGFASITDTFKNLEEAITVSNANNGGRPMTNAGSTGRAGTALSGGSKTGRNAGKESTEQNTTA